jgi:hypothetical protein
VLGKSAKNDWSKNMKITTAKVLVALLSLAASTAALSQNNQGQNNDDQGRSGERHVRAPEISPAEAMGALALLGGAVAIVRGYRRRQK